MILRGDKLAKKINSQTKAEVKNFKTKPGLAAVLIGNNPASRLYVSIKKAEAKKIRIDFYEIYFSEKTKEEEILSAIKLLNKTKNVHGIIVQLPLPKKFNTNKIIQSIDPKKDVDGFHKENIKKLLHGKPRVISPLISATLELIKSSGENITNKQAIIIANSKIFADSLTAGLKREKIGSQNIKRVKEVSAKTKKIISEADIIIIAVGKPKILKKDFVKKGAIVIDIGINKVKGKTVGDVDFESVKNKTGFITPVPKGVGPMTVAMLLKNTAGLAKK